MPAMGGVDINMNSAELAADVLTIENEPGRPQASGDRGVLKNADFNVGDVKRFALDQRRFNSRDPLVFAYLLAVRKRAGEIITVHAMKESATAQLDGARSFSSRARSAVAIARPPPAESPASITGKSELAQSA